MSVTPKCIINPVYLTTSYVQYYLVNKGATIIDKLTAYNNASTYQTITINLVPSGGTLATANRIINNFVIAPGETYEFSNIEGHVLNQGDSIYSLTNSATAAITIRCSGREVAL